MDAYGGLIVYLYYDSWTRFIMYSGLELLMN